MGDADGDFTRLASYRRCIDRIREQWVPFQKRRADCLRHGDEVEVIAEEILRDLFTRVLDWSDGDLLRQEGRADIILSQHLRKYLVLEAKRPGTLWPGRQSLDAALVQARRYADEQGIACIGASDGRFLCAADVEHGNLKERAILDLENAEPPMRLWWLSVHGIYRPCEEQASLSAFTVSIATPMAARADEGLRHSQHNLPAECFAYVGNANDTRTWKLPYLNEDGTIDARRLPMAIQALLRNYRGARVGGIPEQAIPGVLEKLAAAATAVGKMPPQATNPAPAYRDLAAVLDQLRRRKP